ncbi:Porin P precursor [Thalassoglobus neptunius]|uniref:Porin P n=1 Tax=Thalassoglobus neptunius TaxID=1938619 RepID=A0A5C5XAV3_9PLAN|nr:porin [Thalassoglobus neptunius]TWT59012.1 Porin P precursor [Thalassoglobus neptunius]
MSTLRKYRWTFAFLCFGAILAPAAFAEDEVKLDPQVRLLLERLEAAEKQIQTLTNELKTVKEAQAKARPFPQAQGTTEDLNDLGLPIGVDGVFTETGAEDSLRDIPSVAREMVSFEEIREDAPDSIPAELEERLSLLEEGWDDLDSAWTKFHEAEQKKKFDAAKKPTMSINGRIHADYWDFVHNSEGIGYFEHPDPMSDNYGRPPEDRALFRRIRLEMKGDILETMLWRVQLDFNNPGTPEMKDVYLGFKELPFNQQLLIGNQKRPLGLDHLNSSRYNVFLERPFVVEAFNEDARRPGIAMYGYSDDELFTWRYGAYFLENIATDGRVIGQSNQMSLNGRLSSAPWYDEASGGRGYLHLAIAGMAARTDGDRNDSDTNQNEARFRTRVGARTDTRWLNTERIAAADHYEIIGLESIFNYGPLQLVSEYQHNWVQREGEENLQFGGAYAYISYFLTGEHIPYDRKTSTIGRVKPFENFFLVDQCTGGCGTGWGAWNVALRYDYLDLSDDNVLGGVGEAWTSALNWHWTPYSKLQFDASYGEIDNHRPVDGFTSGNYFFFGTRFAVEF